MKIHLPIVLLVLTVFSSTASAQTTIATVDRDIYDRALEIVLPMTVSETAFDYAYSVRVRPAFEPEFAIEIVSRSGTVEMTRCESANGNLFSFFSQAIEKTGDETPEALAKRVELKCEKKTFAETKFRRLKSDFARGLSTVTDANTAAGNLKRKNLDKPESAEIIIDGTVYEAKYFSRSREQVSFRVYDFPSKSKRFDSVMTYWIRGVQDLFTGGHP